MMFLIKPIICFVIFIISFIFVLYVPRIKKNFTRIRCKLDCKNTVYECCALGYCFSHCKSDCGQFCFRMNLWKKALSEMNFGGHKFLPRYLEDQSGYVVIGICDKCGYQIKAGMAERDTSFKQVLDTCKMVEIREVIES